MVNIIPLLKRKSDDILHREKGMLSRDAYFRLSYYASFSQTVNVLCNKITIYFGQ